MGKSNAQKLADEMASSLGDGLKKLGGLRTPEGRPVEMDSPFRMSPAPKVEAEVKVNDNLPPTEKHVPSRGRGKRKTDRAKKPNQNVAKLPTLKRHQTMMTRETWNDVTFLADQIASQRTDKSLRITQSLVMRVAAQVLIDHYDPSQTPTNTEEELLEEIKRQFKLK